MKSKGTKSKGGMRAVSPGVVEFMMMMDETKLMPNQCTRWSNMIPLHKNYLSKATMDSIDEVFSDLERQHMIQIHRSRDGNHTICLTRQGQSFIEASHV